VPNSVPSGRDAANEIVLTHPSRDGMYCWCALPIYSAEQNH
jgi:hypothetical protein